MQAHACRQGLVMQSLKLKNEARDAFAQAVRLEPAFWPAWAELGKFVDNVGSVPAFHLSFSNDNLDSLADHRAQPPTALDATSLSD
jgi:hypothetical protein